MTSLNKYSWEATHITIIAGVITTLTLVTHLLETPRMDTPTARSASAILPTYMLPFSAVPTQSVPDSHPVKVSSQPGATDFQRSDPREVTVGPSGISNRYTLLSAEREPVSSKGEQLIIRLHIESLATEPLVSPFESDMLEIRSPGLPPINPSTSFRTPIPSGNSRNQDIVFNIPQGLSLDEATLLIHYYNYQSEIPLNFRAGK